MESTLLATINHNVVIIEAVIGVVVVLLLVGIVVASHRRKKAQLPKPPEAVPNYYADLQQQPAGRPDPFSAFASATSSPTTPPARTLAGTFPGESTAPAYPGSSAPSAFAGAVPGSELSTTAGTAQEPSPPADTPPGWLPDPGGAPDTLRYWDGNAWTQHFAQRS
jgi:cytoskeletal protein RodZ